LIPTGSDANGNYTLGVPVNWSGTVTPVNPATTAYIFGPAFRSYTNVTASQAGQDYFATASLATPLQSVRVGSNLFLYWNGHAGLTYQLFYSSNLTSVAWYPLDGQIAGTNDLMQVQIPIGNEPEMYFRLRTQN
jgi:hypothetical protein